MVYEFKPCSYIKASAQVAGEICEQLAKTGGLTPKRLVDANRPEDAPLHSEFEWNDAVAAEAYREGQAAHIIRCIVVKPEQVEETPMRAFVRATPEPLNYTPIQTVMETQPMMDYLRAEARKDMENFVRKYESIEELNEVIDSMNRTLDKAV